MKQLIDKSLFDILIKHIEKIFDENDNEIKFTSINQKIEKKRFGYNPTIHIYIDDKIEIKSNYKIQYKCRCENIVTILACKYFSKNRMSCLSCFQKRNWPDNKLHNYKGKVKKVTEKIIPKFEDETDEFKQKFYQSHLTKEEFFKYLPYIYSLDNIVLTDDIRKNIEYIEHIYCSNAVKYTNKFKIKNDSKLHNISIKLKCSICGEIFNVHTYNMRNKDLNELKCRKCALMNCSYPIRLYDNSGLTYQSGLEKTFIDLCKSKNIKIVNGFEIEYLFKNKKHIYVSDFYLPNYKMLIEIKSRNHFYRNDKKSGKIKAKINAANEFCNKNGLKFYMLFDEDIEKFINNLINTSKEKDSLNLQETVRS